MTRRDALRALERVEAVGVGRLHELRVKAGDVVKCVESMGLHTPGQTYTMLDDNFLHVADYDINWELDYAPAATFSVEKKNDQ